MNKNVKKSNVKQLLINVKNIFENIDVENWTCEMKIEIDLNINDKSINAKKKFFVCNIIINTVKKFFFLFWTIVVCSICSNFWFFVIAFFSIFSFFKTVETFAALNFEIFTFLTNLYFFNHVSINKINTKSNDQCFLSIKKIEALCEFNSIKFSTMKKLAVLITSTKAINLIYWNMLWINMCFKFEIKSAFVEIVYF